MALSLLFGTGWNTSSSTRLVSFVMLRLLSGILGLFWYSKLSHFHIIIQWFWCTLCKNYHVKVEIKYELQHRLSKEFVQELLRMNKAPLLRTWTEIQKQNSGGHCKTHPTCSSDSNLISFQAHDFLELLPRNTSVAISIQWCYNPRNDVFRFAYRA